MNGMWGKPLGWAAALSLFIFQTASAQEPATPESPPPTYDQTVPVESAPAPAPEEKRRDEVKLERVEVTGTRLKRTDYESAAPVAVITREDIDRTGLTSISEILSQLTAAGNDSLNAQQQSVFLTGGETNLDLRNLGPTHTLILVNGHRWVAGLISTSTSVVDLNTIPTAIIERIEVLKDGASAIYGSDAIAGVVNIITRKDYNGFGLTSQVGQFIEQGDGLQQQHELSWGMARGGTSIFANLSYTEEQVAWAQRRKSTYAPIPAAGITRWGRSRPEGRFLFVASPSNGAFFDCPSLNGDVGAGVVEDPGGTIATGPIQGGTLPGIRLTQGQVHQIDSIPAGIQLCDLTYTDGANTGTIADYHLRDEQNERFNFFNGAALQNPSKRYAGYTQFTQNIMEGLSFTFDGLYNYRDSRAIIGNFPIAGGDLLGFTPNAYASRTNQYNPFQQDIGQPSPEAPVSEVLGESGIYTIRALNGPDYHYGDIYRTLRLSGGLKYEFDVLGHIFDASGGWIYSNNTADERTPFYRNDLLARAVGPASGCTGDCVPLDIFHGASGITQAALDYIYFIPDERTNGRQDIAYADLVTDLGPVHLPAGPISVALGFEFRRDQYQFKPDPIVASGVTDLNALLPTEGKQSTREPYIELGIPLLNDLPLMRALDLDVAARWSSYSSFATQMTGKGGLRWKPYDDLLLRGTYASGFRAPNIGELNLGPGQSFDALDDPCVSQRANPTVNANCNADGVPANVGPPAGTPYDIFEGNPNLKPEHSRSTTIGLVFSPSFIRDLNLTVDFYRIALKGFITIPPGQFFLDSCYDTTQRTFCENIHRAGDGTLQFLDTPYTNYNSVNTSGIDGSLDFRLPIAPALGRLKFALDASYLIRYDTSIPVPGQPSVVTGLVGQSSVAGGFFGFPRWKANASLVWKRDQFQASWTTRMVYEVMEDCVDGLEPSLSSMHLCSDPKIDENGFDVSKNRLRTIFYHNVQVGYTFQKFATDITIGVNNVLDQDPPQAFNSGLYNYDPSRYDTPGRFAYAKIGAKF